MSLVGKMSQVDQLKNTITFLLTVLCVTTCAAFGFCFYGVYQTSEVENLKSTVGFLLTIICAAICTSFGYCFSGLNKQPVTEKVKPDEFSYLSR